ncbi:MAG: hypothetical protein A4E41_01645 [Methanoregulaceae archaeon PtaU1.Bin066]|nr:MAG: hypothetical protein A4E41_01645 [Methanoregulaceae archaeon PtaU1.Bin066]
MSSRATPRVRIYTIERRIENGISPEAPMTRINTRKTKKSGTTHFGRVDSSLPATNPLLAVVTASS